MVIVNYYSAGDAQGCVNTSISRAQRILSKIRITNNKRM